MGKLTLPIISEHVYNQLITYSSSHKVERRLNLRARLFWTGKWTYL